MSTTLRALLFALLTVTLFAVPAPIAASAAGGALQCDGVNDYVAVPDLQGDFDFTTAITVEAWVRYDTAVGVDGVAGGFFPPDYGAFVLGRDSPPKGVFSISTPATNSAYTALSLATGVWTHIAGTYDGAVIRFYVNGVLDGTQAKTGDVSDITELRLCRYPRNVSSYHQGAIDEVRIWKVARTASQIHDNYLHALTGNEPGLVGYYRFDEGSGQVVVDSSSRGNDGYLGASTTAGTDDPSRVPSGAPLLGPGPCVRNAATACLLEDRFEVKVSMKNFAQPPATFEGLIQNYQGVSSETDQSVSFYSFQNGNVEVFVKMVDACSNPGFVSFWLFAAGATNAETDITVRDTLSGEVQPIHNPSGVLFQTVANTNAFKTCAF